VDGLWIWVVYKFLEVTVIPTSGLNDFPISLVHRAGVGRYVLSFSSFRFSTKTQARFRNILDSFQLRIMYADNQLSHLTTRPFCPMFYFVLTDFYVCEAKLFLCLTN
jgi:hypothetical protein